MLLKRLSKVFSFVFVFVLLVGSFSLPVSAQQQAATFLPTSEQICGGPCPLIDSEFTLSQGGLFAFIIAIANFLTYIGVAIAILWLIFAGFQFIIGRGESAKKNVVSTLTGLVIIVIAYTVVNILVSLLQSNSLGGIFGGGNSTSTF